MTVELCDKSLTKRSKRTNRQHEKKTTINLIIDLKKGFSLFDMRETSTYHFSLMMLQFQYNGDYSEALMQVKILGP